MGLEFLLVLTLFGGAVWLTQRYTTHHYLSESMTADGIFTSSTPFKMGTSRPFHDLILQKNCLVLHDAAGQKLMELHFSNLIQTSSLRLDSDSTQITLYFEAVGTLQLVTLQMSQTDMALLVGTLRQHLPADRLNLNGHLPEPGRPIPARLVTETLHGEVQPETDVALYLVPPLLFVLKDETIIAKLDMRTIRRILAVERSSGRVDALLNRATAEGLIRLYSLHETAVFALSAYQETAEAIAQIAGCPVEFISRDEKVKYKS